MLDGVNLENVTALGALIVLGVWVLRVLARPDGRYSRLVDELQQETDRLRGELARLRVECDELRTRAFTAEARLASIRRDRPGL